MSERLTMGGKRLSEMSKKDLLTLAVSTTGGKKRQKARKELVRRGVSWNVDENRDAVA